MKKFLLFACLAAMLIVFGCSSSKKAFKQAREYEEAGLYVEAAEFDLKALHDKPGYKEAKVHLKKVGPRAYEELLQRAEKLEGAENWDQAVSEYRHLGKLLRDMNSFGVVFETVNVKQRLSAAKRRAAEYHYSHAEAFFKKKQWRKAANAYLKANDYVDNYNNSFVKAIQSLVNAGDRQLKAGQFQAALKSYQRALKVAPNHKLVKSRMANAYYLQGKHLFEEKDYRQALQAFEAVEDYVPGFKDAQNWADRAYEKAVQYVAVVPFLNESRVAVDGYFLASEILQKLQHVELPFADFMDHAQTVAMLSSIRRGRYGSVSEAQLLDAAKEQGLDAIVWGKVKEVSVKDRPEKVTEYEDEKVVVVQDSSGKDVESREPIYYREHVRRRVVKIAVEYVILDCETGRYLDKQRFRDDIVDEAVWIAYQGSVYDLPESKRPLLDARRNPQDVPVLLDQLLQKMSDRISRQVERFFK